MKKPSYDQQQFPHWAQVAVRYRDLDPLNHVNNAAYNTYFEEARVNFIQQFTPFKQGMKNGFNFVLASITIDYIRPIEYPATLQIGSGFTELGNTSIRSLQAVYDADSKQLYSTCSASMVWFNVQQQTTAPLPEIPNADKFMV